MKNFVYTARDAAGVLKKGDIEASDRSAALAMLKGRGLAPVSLAEGSAARAPGGGRGIYAAMAIIGLTAAVYVALTLSPTAGTEPERTKIEISVKPQPAQSPQFAVNETDAPPVAALDEPPVQTTSPERTAILVLGDDPGKRGSSRDSHYGEPVKSGEGETNKPRRVFATGTEQVIGWIANTRMGDPPPVLPMLPAGEDIGKILDTDIVLYDDDDEKAELVKTRVAEMKQHLKKYLEAGGSPQEFLQVYQKQLQDAHDEWRMSQSELAKRIREGDKAAAAVFLEARNKELQAKGIRPLVIPPFLREK